MVERIVHDLDSNILDRVDEELNAGYELFKKGSLDSAERHYREAWRLIPEPKYGWDASQSTLILIARFFRDKGDLDEAKRWIARVFEHCAVQDYEGQPLLVAGTIYYEAGEMAIARQYLERAYKASRGRSFQTEDPKYLKFIRSK